MRKRIRSDSIKRVLSNIYTVRADFIYSKYKDSVPIYFYKGLEIDDSELNNALIGNYYATETKNTDSARYYLDKALDMLEEEEYWTVRRGVVYSFYGHYLYQEERLDEASAYYEKAAEILLKTNRVNKLPFIYSDIIQISTLLKDHQKEEEYKYKRRAVHDSLIVATTNATDIALNDAILEIDGYKEKRFPQKLVALLMSGLVLVLAIGFIRKRKNTNPGSEGEDIPVVKDASDSQLAEIVKLAKEGSPEFLVHFNEYYPQFSKKLYKINPDLSDYSITFCALIWLGYSSKEIAQMISIQYRSVQTQKSRIRKKLNIDSNTDLGKFFREL